MQSPTGSAGMGMSPEEVERMKRYNADVRSGAVQDLSTLEEGVGADQATGKTKEQVMSPTPAGPTDKNKAVDTASTGMMMSGNPYVMAAGLALQGVNQVDQAKRASEQEKINAYNRKVMQQRSAIRNMFE